MKEVANINNIPVYSDKDVQSISHTKVTFTDGSWCDVATGKIVNEGGGYINIDNPDSKNSKKDVAKEKTFEAAKLHISGTNAEIRVSVRNGKKTKVVIAGPESKVKKIICEVKGDTLKISDANTESSSKNNINISGNSISISSGSLHISSISGSKIISNGSTIITGGQTPDITIIIQVPKGTSIKAEKINGTLAIGEVDGDMELSTNSGKITAGLVKNALLSIQGSGDIIIWEMTGNLVANVQGSGDIEVKSGSIPSISANLKGSGDIKFDGEAENANLSIMGSGDIKVRFVKNKPITSVMGSGDIRVKNW